MTNEDESYERENGGNRQSKGLVWIHGSDRKLTREILILESSDKGRPAKEIYKPKKRITDLGLEAQFSNLSTQERFSPKILKFFDQKVWKQPFKYLFVTFYSLFLFANSDFMLKNILTFTNMDYAKYIRR